ncbi:transcriptional regulator [Stutzerimonas azotifigens]|uniref:Transcriptional regulator n=1 Tax=Stutzerimonas azotifigens TaxID=291995 RepID=A0ABR5YWC3_9GAMM|nr:transcriptional regulator [Stutzerimonas azotifigens]MBA1272226.1 transcriptional regulator [Stutzerimonas azotifigens]
MSYNWDLILRLLHEVQNSANDTFKPRRYAEEHAQAMEAAGQPLPNLDHLRAEASDYESLLFEGKFIATRPTDEGGTGENFVLTERGAQLLRLIDASYPNSDGFRQQLDEQGEAALVPEIFDDLAAKAAVSN